jgi:RNA polymerase sigma factor (sigma-70 family)
VQDDLFREAYPHLRRAVNLRAAVLRGLRAEGLDQGDIEQEAALAVFRRLGRFDPRRASLPTFVDRVVASAAASLVRRGMAKKRTRIDSELANHLRVHTRVTPDLQVDIFRALSRLSCADQNVAHLVLLEYTPAEIARELGCSRAAVYRSRDRIRSALEVMGLGKISS